MWKNNIARRTFAVLFAITVWQIAALIVNIEFLFPSPINVILRLFSIWREENFLISITSSFAKIVLGFLSGLACGTALAIIAARFSIIEDLLWPFMIMVKSVPVASFIVLALMWLTSKELSVFIAFLMVVPIIYTNILTGIKSADKGLDKMALVFRMSFPKKLLYIWIPRIKPFLLSACSLGIGLSWKAGIAAEIIANPRGTIGTKLGAAKLYLNTEEMFAWTLTVIALSLLLEFGAMALLNRWERKPSEQEDAV